MHWIDLIILFSIGYFAYRGFVNGLVKEVLSIVGIILAVFVTFTYMDEVSALLEPIIDSSSDVSVLITGVVLFLAILVLVHGIAFLISKFLKAINLNIINRILGFAFGGLKCAIIISALLLFLAGFSLPDEDVRAQSVSYPLIIQLAPEVYNIVATVYPGAEDFVTTIQTTLEESNSIQKNLFFNF